MKIFAIYETIQTNDSDGWQYWTEEALVKLFTEDYNAETYINELLLKKHDDFVNKDNHYSHNLEHVRKRADMILNNKGVFFFGTRYDEDSEDSFVDSLYFIKEINVEECPSLNLNCDKLLY